MCLWSHSPPARLSPEVRLRGQEEVPSLLSVALPEGPMNVWSLQGGLSISCALTKFRAGVRKNSENGFSEEVWLVEQKTG